MALLKKLGTVSGFLQALLLVAAQTAIDDCNPEPKCKATPNSHSWPREYEWASLNRSLSGRLLKPPPPGAVCHPGQPTFNAAACPAVQAGWLTSVYHSDNPVSTIQNNWNNDTCLPYPTDPCSGEGYPIYVVNATNAEDVKKGVDFARENNIRLIVKGTGHDYLGRSVAPNSLSIWTHNIQGISFHDSFRPKGCRFSIDGPAATAAAGTQMIELDSLAQQHQLTIVGGGAGTVGVGGYLTGGGHSWLSMTYGMAADQVLEIEMVTPGGDILVVNECQNEDLFWAMRGGGGSTFGVLTSVTVKAFPSFEFAFATVTVGGPIEAGDQYWDAVTDIVSAFPTLSDEGISGYTNIVPNITIPSIGFNNPVNGFSLLLALPLISASLKTSDSFQKAINETFKKATAPYPQVALSIAFQTFPNFFAFYNVTNGPLDGGNNVMLGSRLLDGKALSGNRTALKQALQQSTPPSAVTEMNLVAGKNVWNAHPRGGSNAINPAWRKAYVHAIATTDWTAFDRVKENFLVNQINATRTQALRDLAPDSGAYVNEAFPWEPNFQHAFWGDNYPRLLKIKREVDPWDVFWCQPCVGNERWHEIDGALCKLPLI